MKVPGKMKVPEHWRIRLFLLLGFIALLMLPVVATEVRNFPKADTKYIRRVFTNNTVGQSFTTRVRSHGISVLVRSQTDQNSTLIVTDAASSELGRSRFKVGPRDQWVPIRFTSPLRAGDHTLTFTTIPNVSQEQAIELRYQPLSESYEGGHMISNGSDSYGDLAFRTFSRLPFWQSLLIGSKFSQASFTTSIILILTGVVVGILLWLVRLFMPKTGRSALIALVLVVLILGGIIIRLPVLASLEGTFGGDIFNYLSKAQAPLIGVDPFAADPRKGPLFSALLTPGFFTADPVLWARWISLLSAVGATLLLVGLARQFSLPWGLAVGGGLLLAVNQDFIWESVNGLANTLYVTTIMAAFLFYLLAHKRWAQWLLAITCGLIFLTRFEGGTFAVVLLGALWWREKLSWRTMGPLVAVTIAIMLIPQVSFLLSGNSGIRSLEDVNSDAGLFVVRSMEDLLNNVGRFERFLTSAWLTPKLGGQGFILPGLIIGLFGGAVLSWSRLKWPKLSLGYRLVVGSTILLIFIGLIVISSDAARGYLVALPWLLIGLGVVPWWRARPWDATVLFLALCIQTIIIIFILPKPRYFLPLLPYFSLLMVFGIQALLRWQTNRYAWLTPLVFVGILASFFYVDGQNAVQDKIEHHNLKAETITPMMNAMKFLRLEDRPVGLRSSDLEQSITTYLPEKHRITYSVPPGKFATVADEELAWISQVDVALLLERNNESIWESVRAYPDLFEHRHTYDSTYGDSRVLIYGVHRQALREFLGAAN